MVALELCLRYIPEFPKLTKSNSFIHMGRVVVVIGKEHDGKDSKARHGVNAKGATKYKTAYHAYDKETKIQLSYHKDKDTLIQFIKRQNLGVLNEESK